MTDSRRPSPLGRSTLARVALIALVALVLLVPIALVRGLVTERRLRGAAAAAEIASAWGGRQTVAPPALRLVYACTSHDAKGEPSVERTSSVLLPESLAVGGELEPEIRARGIFSTVVYRAKLRVRGEYVFPGAAALGVDCPAPVLESALLVLGVADNRGIDRLGELDWTGIPPAWAPGGGFDGPWEHGVSARLGAGPFLEGAHLPFALELDLRGSEALEIVPVGRETRVELGSSWPSPSFRGAFLPRERRLDASGFRALWTISPFARSFPQSWTGIVPAEVAASALGVTLARPVDGYLQTERALKYALLVVGLTFLACFLLELASAADGVALHPMHYLLVGAALAVFFLLLLSLSEHMGFARAYFAAAAAVTLLLGGYARAILASVTRAAALAGTLGALYGGLYVLLGRDEYALLVGSLGTFAALALTLWLTRRVDWSTAFERRAASA